MKVRTVVCGIVVMTWALPLGAGDRITMKVSPAVASAPTNLIIRTMIEANENNRTMEIVAESPKFYRSSEIQLNGERAPRTAMFEFRSVPGGTYEVRATVRDQGGNTLASAWQQVNVIDSAAADR